MVIKQSLLEASNLLALGNFCSDCERKHKTVDLLGIRYHDDCGLILYLTNLAQPC